ncbi:helix-turn-helix domain-containing protein [Streptomyces sp. NPDC056309]|uniref:helix-turn-helix domain-containing protein n=1 Tax=unclassified Streptomyces TaxID=2593676 RepID=UPI0035D8257A
MRNFGPGPFMGSQKPGGLIEATHEDIAEALGYSRPHISRAFNVLEADGALRRLQRGIAGQLAQFGARRR